MRKKQVVAGLGEIGNPIMNLLSKSVPTIGYDIDPKKLDKKFTKKYENLQTGFLHICIPYTSKFNQNVISLFKKFQPEGIIIHSTIKPGTTKNLQKKIPVPIIYSATRGVHRRMLNDIKRYTKFYSVYPKSPNSKVASLLYSKIMKNCGVKVKKMSTPLTLETAKIVCDTSYYGWLINYAQLSKMIAIKNNIDYDEMWTFAEEIHKILGNRPKMFPGFIGGHCIIPNLDLMDENNLNLIKEINSDYAKILKRKRIKKS